MMDGIDWQQKLLKGNIFGLLKKRGEIGMAVLPCCCIVVDMLHFVAENCIHIAAMILLINLCNN